MTREGLEQKDGQRHQNPVRAGSRRDSFWFTHTYGRLTFRPSSHLVVGGGISR